MPNLHDLATTIGNSALLSILSALAAGFAALALMAGVSKAPRSSLPADFPDDPEAQLDKYVMPFRQLDQVGKASAQDISTLAEQMKNQPAAHLALTAFQKFGRIRKTPTPAANNNRQSGSARAKPTGKTTGSSEAISVEPDSDEEEGDDQFPRTVNISLPNQTTKKAK